MQPVSKASSAAPEAPSVWPIAVLNDTSGGSGSNSARSACASTASLPGLPAACTLTRPMSRGRSPACASAASHTARTAPASLPAGLLPSTMFAPPAMRQRAGRVRSCSAAKASPSTSPSRPAPKGRAPSGDSSCIAPKPATVKRLSGSAPSTSASSAPPPRSSSEAARIALSAEVQAVDTVKTGPRQASAPATISAKSSRSPPSRRSSFSCSMWPMSSEDEATNSGASRDTAPPERSACATTARTRRRTRSSQPPSVGDSL